MNAKAALFVILLAAAQAGGARAVKAEYQLGVQDRLRIHVHEWPVLTGEFTIGPDGKIALPMIGEVSALGLVPAALAGKIAESLKAKANLLELPDAAVSVIQYRPFYILGGVERPGEYAYRPQMVVLNAVTIAGGVYRPPRTSDWGFERDSIIGRGDMRTVLVKREELAAKEWRLKAEAAGTETLPPPEDSLASSRFVDEERGIFAARLERHRNQIAALEQSKSLHEREIVSIQEQSRAAQSQRESVARELEETRSLISKQLAVPARILPIERTLAQIEREQRELETAVLRARQQINQLAAQQVTARDERRGNALSELQALLAQLKELDERFATASRLISGSMAMSSEPKNDAEPDSNPQLSFVILRPIGDRIEEMQANETTHLLPGDILKVFRPQEAPRSSLRQDAPLSSQPAKDRLGALR